MKTGLLAAVAAAALLLGVLLYFRTQAPPAPDPAGPSGAKAPAAPDSMGLSQAALDPGEADRSAPPPAPIAVPVPAAEPAPAPAAVAVVPPSIPEASDPRSEVFEAKYAELGSEARRAALESLRRLLEAHREGAVGAGQQLTDEQIRDSKLEIEWLVAHP